MIKIKHRYTGKVLHTTQADTLVGADLRSADLYYADLSGADLSGANLRGAALRGANLRGANLSGANLRVANLRGADLRSADLSGADLSGAALRDAALRDADLSGADLRGADLSCADLRGADLSDVPKVESMIAQIPTDRVDMDTWHASCGTAHCLAGWAIALAGPEGTKLEKKLGTAAAGALIWAKSTGEVPEFYCSDNEAIKYLKNKASK